MSSSEYAEAMVNASPLICLAKAGLLNALLGVFPKVCIPRAVYDEVMDGPDDDCARLFLQKSEGYTIVEPGVMNEVVRDWDLGAGETAVLNSVIDKSGTIAVIDDAAARKCARTLDVPYCGSLGILVKAHKAGVIGDLNASISVIQESGLYLSQTIIDRLRTI